jgi:hypothetical protein
MARAPNYGFEKQQRERARAEKNAARQKAKAERKKMPSDGDAGGAAESAAIEEGDTSPPSAG